MRCRRRGFKGWKRTRACTVSSTMSFSVSLLSDTFWRKVCLSLIVDFLFSSLTVDGSVPSNMLLGFLRPSWYLAACMMGWGTVSACTGAVFSFGGKFTGLFVDT